MADLDTVNVVVTGSFGVGKTTLIRSLSEINVLTTERRVGTTLSDGSDTLAMDFGRMGVGDDLSIHLFGTPGRDQFDFMWGVVSRGLLGFIVLLDGTRPQSVEEAETMMAYFRDRADVPYVVAVNKVTPATAERQVKQARHALRIPGHIRVAAVDVRRPDSSRQLLLQLLLAANEDVESRAMAG